MCWVNRPAENPTSSPAKASENHASADTLIAATVIEPDRDNDFCVLDVPGLPRLAARIRQYDTLRIGEAVYPQALRKALIYRCLAALSHNCGRRIGRATAISRPTRPFRQALPAVDYSIRKAT